jgi:hypothetical protein
VEVVLESCAVVDVNVENVVLVMRSSVQSSSTSLVVPLANDRGRSAAMKMVGRCIMK